jgi:hypothetical protein
VTDLATNKPRQITKTSLLTTFVTNIQFINGGKQFYAVFPPDGRTARPLPPAVPAGPEVLVSMDNDKNRLRTFPSLMRTPYEFQLLEWHATGQIGIVDVATGAITKFGTPAMITAVDMNPNGKYARVTRMTKPFSYIVPQSSFGSIEEIWDATGKALAKLSERQLNLGVQADTGPRRRSDEPAGRAAAAAAQAAVADGGRWRRRAEQRHARNGWRADGEGLQLSAARAVAAAAVRRGGGAGRGGNGRGGGGGAAVVARLPGAAGRCCRRGAGGTGAQAAPEPPRKDRLMQWMPPFSDSSTKQIYENPTRMTASASRRRPDHVLHRERQPHRDVRQRHDAEIRRRAWRWRRLVRRQVAAGRRRRRWWWARRGWRRQRSHRYADVATTALSSTSMGSGTPVMLSPDGSSVYFQGTQGGGRGANAAPAHPFIDKVVIKTATRTPLVDVDPGTMTTTVVTVIDPE